MWKHCSNKRAQSNVGKSLKPTLQTFLSKIKSIIKHRSRDLNYEDCRSGGCLHRARRGYFGYSWKSRVPRKGYDTQNCNWCMIILVIQAKSWLLQLMLYQYIRYVELSAHSRSKCTMQMTLYRVASIASPCENFQDDIITASLLYRTQFRVQIQGLIFQSLIA